jgi:hypothetical protein
MRNQSKLVRRPWTTEGLRKLKAHSENGTPIAVVSRELERTIGALRQQAYRLQIPLGRRQRG